MTVHTWQPGMFERPCGGCTMCCKLPAAEPSPHLPEGKTAGVWCQHCDKGQGCRIYKARPEGCRSFMCLWKVMPDFPEELRPDKCKVIYQMAEDGSMVTALTEHPERIGSPAMRRLVTAFQREGIRINVVVGRP